MRKKLKENTIVYCIGASGYTLLEMIWRGYTHWTMAVTGGLCFLLIYKANLKLDKKNIILKCLTGAIVVTSIEFLVGVIVNLELRWNVWDYSSIPLNLFGQVCLLYSIMWFLLCFPLSSLCKFIRKFVNRKQVTNV